MENIKNNLNKVNGLQELGYFCNNIEARISPYGGRRFTYQDATNGRGSIALKDIVTRFKEICKETPDVKDSGSYDRIIEEIDKLDKDASKLLKTQSTGIKVIAAIKHFLAGFNRSQFHKEFLPTYIKNTRKALNNWLKNLSKENKEIVKKHFPSITHFVSKFDKENDLEKSHKLRMKASEKLSQETRSFKAKIDSGTLPKDYQEFVKGPLHDFSAKL